MKTNQTNIMKDYGMTVYVNERGLEDALRRFKKRVEKSGMFDELKEREFYTKPSAVKREQCKKRKR